MKHAITITAALALSLLSMTMQLHAKDDNGHSLTDLWKTFYTARGNDRPKEETAILEKIKKEALAKDLAWDYYDACEEYVSSRCRSNWKLREKAEEDFKKEIEEHGAPVAVLYYRFNYGSDGADNSEFILKYRDRFLKGHNPEFYARDYVVNSEKYSEPLLENLSNDYEYALWALNARAGKEDTQARSYFAGRYPLDAFLDYRTLSRRDATEEEQKAFLDKYSGKAAALLLQEDILDERFTTLKRENAPQDSFRLLDEDCRKFIKSRDSFGSSEKKLAECCTSADALVKALNGRRTGFKLTDGKLELHLRNVEEVTVSIIPGGKKRPATFERKISNTVRSFFVTDTLKVELPALDDGEYTICCKAAGCDDAKDNYSRHTLSIAGRSLGSGSLAAYVADYLSGEPVRMADFVLTDRDGNTVAEARGLHLDGFTELPSNIVSSLSKGCRLQASYRDSGGFLRSSFAVRVSPGSDDGAHIDESALHCNLLTDRSAFNPEETVHFKAIIYQGHYNFRTCGEAVPVRAVLRDPKGNELSSLDLRTDGFGSAAGEFTLPRCENNGLYSIDIYSGDSRLTSRRIRVDDFVLPTFALTWDEDRSEYHPGDTVRVSGKIKSYSGHNLGAADVTYSVSRYGEILDGPLKTGPDGNFTIEFPSSPDDNWQSYRISIKVIDTTGETKEFSRSIYIRRAQKKEEPEEYFFRNLEDKPAAVRVVAGDKPVWAVAELFGEGRKLLEKKLVTFSPEAGRPAETVIGFDYKDSYPDVISLKILYFQNGDCHEHSLTARRSDESWKLPLRFTRFLDTSAPGARYTFSLKTEAGVQCAATIFDKSTETVMGNRWNAIAPNLKPAPNVFYSVSDGSDEAECHLYDDFIGYGKRLSGGSKGMVMMANAAPSLAYARAADDIAVEETVIEEAVAEETPEDGYIRENFANTIAWEPCLRSDKDGNVSFTFTSADKLSTYYVQIFAHDKAMRNAAIRREMVVTLPVKFAVVEPQILHDGDNYVMRATLSNSTSFPVPGIVSVDILNGADSNSSEVINSGIEKIIVPANGTASFEKEIDVRDISHLGIRMTFTPDDKEQGSDGIFVSIPVLKAVQTITEAHSSLLFADEDREALIEGLRGQFVNFPGSEASLREISILDLLKEAVPERVDPKADNAVALTEALYAGMLADSLSGRPFEVNSGILEKILKLQTSEGGFTWFDGMEAAPIVTCLVLERFHKMGIAQGTDAAVKYLDDTYFRKEALPWWRGGISQAHYLYIRSLYPGIEFSAKDISADFRKEFRKSAKAYLVPAKTRGLNGNIFAKTRRVETLSNLISSDEGLRLASKWGIKLAAGARLGKSLSKDIESLSQYAEPHSSGGMYFPNAVMPFRGLLESEAYAHAHLCRLMDGNGHSDIADGVRLWLMVQKETQKWDSDPGYLEALNAVFEGSEKMLATKVIALKGSVTVPFEQVRAAGNGFTIERQYFKDGKQLGEGETLKVGDRITAVYKIHNGENRSFVKLTAPRGAALRPLNQLSGYHWGCWRNVLKDRTEYWYQSYPEEDTEVREEFYVQQAGTFRSGAVEIVCEYADHYRANDAGRPAMRVEK